MMLPVVRYMLRVTKRKMVTVIQRRPQKMSHQRRRHRTASKAGTQRMAASTTPVVMRLVPW